LDGHGQNPIYGKYAMQEGMYNDRVYYKHFSKSLWLVRMKTTSEMENKLGVYWSIVGKLPAEAKDIWALNLEENKSPSGNKYWEIRMNENKAYMSTLELDTYLSPLFTFGNNLAGLKSKLNEKCEGNSEACKYVLNMVDQKIAKSKKLYPIDARVKVKVRTGSAGVWQPGTVMEETPMIIVKTDHDGSRAIYGEMDIKIFPEEEEINECYEKFSKYFDDYITDFVYDIYSTSAVDKFITNECPLLTRNQHMEYKISKKLISEINIKFHAEYAKCKEVFPVYLLKNSKEFVDDGLAAIDTFVNTQCPNLSDVRKKNFKSDVDIKSLIKKEVDAATFRKNLLLVVTAMFIFGMFIVGLYFMIISNSSAEQDPANITECQEEFTEEENLSISVCLSEHDSHHTLSNEISEPESMTSHQSHANMFDNETEHNITITDDLTLTQSDIITIAESNNQSFITESDIITITESITIK
jgi:hypothetical protein